MRSGEAGFSSSTGSAEDFSGSFLGGDSVMAKKKWLRSPTRPDVGADADIPMEEGEALIAKQGEVVVASKGGFGCYISSRLNIFSSGDLVTEKKKKPLRSPSRPPSTCS